MVCRQPFASRITAGFPRRMGCKGIPAMVISRFRIAFPFCPTAKGRSRFSSAARLPRAWFLSMKTGQPTAPRNESWGSRETPVYRKKAPRENSECSCGCAKVGERSPAPTSLFLCLYDSDAALRDTIIALGNGDTLHKYYTMPSMGMQAKSKRKGMCIQPVPTDSRERAGQPFPCLLKSDSICPLNAPSPTGTSAP